MKDLICPICSASSIKPHLEIKDKLKPESGTFRLHRCKNCGFIFLFPKPQNIELGKYYIRAYWQKRGKSLVDKIYYFVVNYTKLNQIRHYKKSGKLLDVGCGSGEFLDFTRRNGFEVWGTEIFKFAAELAKKFTNNICINFLTNCKFESNSFDVVNLTDVLHQMSEPENELKEIRRIIKSDGILVIEVPDSDCWQFKLFKQDWFYQDSPRHISYFNQRNLSLLLKKCCFNVVSLRRLALVYILDFFHSASQKLIHKPKIIKLFLKPVLLSVSIIIKLFPLSRGSIRIIARPV